VTARRAGWLRRRGRRPATAAGVFLTHRDTPRIRDHFARLVAESGGLVTWQFVLSHDTYPRPEAPFAYPDPADVMPARYRAMEEHGGVQGGYLDTLLVPVLTALEADHLWVCEYDVDFAGHWSDVFGPLADADGDLLTTTLLYRHQQPKWPWWPTAGAPSAVPEERWVRSLNPLMRASRRLLETYAAAMGGDAWAGHYEFTLPTAALEAGLRVVDLGGEGPFVPRGHERRLYIGRSPAGRSEDQTLGFRPVREHYFHEAPEDFEKPGLVYHPVKPGVPVWSRETMNTGDTVEAQDPQP
jgi:hypothetical protein